MKVTPWLFVFVAQNALAAPAPVAHSVTIERRGELPSAWSRLDVAPSPHQQFELRIGLKQSNLHRLEEELLLVSDPTSEAYGQHWTPSRLAEFFRPHEDSISSVKAWLEKAGLDGSRMRASPGGNWLQGVVSVAEVESLLDTKYEHYKHTNDAYSLGCDSYSLPADVRDHIDLIQPTTHLFAPRANARVSAPKSASAALAIQNSTMTCTALTTLACLRQLYNINYVQQATARNSLGIAERYVQSDFDIFAAKYIPSIASIDGGNLEEAANSTSGESNLDVQYACGLAPGVPTTLYQTTGSTILVENYNNFLDALDSSYCNATLDGTSVDCGTVKTTNVISTSYGDAEDVYNPELANRQCAEFGKLGMMGVTLVFSSGDAGADCKGDGSLGGYSEIASISFPSGGGLSNIFSLPSYQATAVKGYLSKFAPIDAGWNSSGNARGYPDISANGENYDVIVDGQSTPEDGTSASAPVVAAIITLANDARIAAGKGPVGFINPALYSAAFKDAFNDITLGSNAPTGCIAEGYTAQAG
ncbi:hypothetical protein RQP46_008660 [Phenoliferia psychrophenolica]